MARSNQKGITYIITKYTNAVKTSWRAAKGEFAQYLQSHDGRTTLKPLTPKNLKGKEIAKYESELLAALDSTKQPKTRNIAITGAYSAGKSSFLHSFMERNGQYRYVNISLAKFCTLDVGSEKDHKQEVSVEIIESSIVQQLLYTASSEKLPDSRVQRIQYHSWKKMLRPITLLTFLG